MFERSHTYPVAVTESSAGSDQALPLAVQWLIGQHRVVRGTPLLLTPRRMSVDYDPLLQDLAKRVQAETPQTLLRAGWPGGAVLACWPSQTDLGKISDSPRTRALVVVPWREEEVQPWVAARSPQLLGAAKPAPAAVLDPVVEQALLTVTAMVNHSNRLAGTLDKRDAVRALQALRRAGYRYDPAQIYTWALEHGWPEQGAARLREFAETIMSGGQVRVQGGDALRPDIVAEWRQRAAARGSDTKRQ